MPQCRDCTAALPGEKFLKFLQFLGEEEEEEAAAEVGQGRQVNLTSAHVSHVSPKLVGHVTKCVV